MALDHAAPLRTDGLVVDRRGEQRRGQQGNGDGDTHSTPGVAIGGAQLDARRTKPRSVVRPMRRHFMITRSALKFIALENALALRQLARLTVVPRLSLQLLTLPELVTSWYGPPAPAAGWVEST